MVDLRAPCPLTGRHILIVEDQYLIAFGLEEMLRSAGAEIAGPIGSVEEALGFVETHGDSIHAVVLDVSLHGKKSYPVADALARQNIPYVLTTGFGAASLDAAYRDSPRCEKPINEAALVRSLVTALG